MDLFSAYLNTPVYQAVLRLAELFRRAGGRAVLVGGSVRDALRGTPVKDFDLEVHGLRGSQVRQIAESCFALDAVGMSFGVLKVKHLEIDISLPRRESKTGAGHRGFLIEEVPNLDFADASARRDFTVNAIMFDPLSEELIDPHHGAEDLHKKILRHVSSHFSEDPLRVLRGMQFLARMEFTAAPETVELCSHIDQSELASERIGTEWEKLLLQGVRPSLGLNFLRQCGWIRFYPELAALIGTPQHQIHHREGDAWTHTLMVLDEAARLRGEGKDALPFMATALTHDLGKPATLCLKDGFYLSPGHATAGVKPAKAMLTRLWNRPGLIEKALILVEHHMDWGQLCRTENPDPQLRRLALKAGGLELLYKLFVADVCGCGANDERKSKIFQDGEALRQRAIALGVWNRAPVPLIQGRMLIARGMKPGVRLGEIVKRCFEAQLDGIFSDSAGAEKFLTRLLKS